MSRKNQPVSLDECHLVINTYLSDINYKDIKKAFENLKIKLGNDEYDIMLVPGYDSYHGYWFHYNYEDFEDDSEIYIIIAEPGEWNEFGYIQERINNLKQNTNDLFDETDVYFVEIPWSMKCN